ncbi:MAG: hypothetical protein IPP17_15930 [Bacteroidetes bacterium]|nr:hypothetical protein [Bacteroidota bacterium]
MGDKTMSEHFRDPESFEQRIRGRFLAREMFEDELQTICIRYPSVLSHLKEGLDRALFHVRPLKSQKDKVGGCTFEKDKTRIPLSHPDFELFRLVQFLQNVRINLGSNGTQANTKDSKGKSKEELPLSIVDQVVAKIVAEKAGKVTQKELQQWLSKMMERDVAVTYHEKVLVPSCPTSHLMYQVLGNDWRHHKLFRTVESGQRQGKVVKIGYVELWHFLREAAERPEKFTIENPVKDYANKLGLDGEAIELLEDYVESMPAGYASMSFNAIGRILPFMRDGHPYHVAVPLAG